MHWFGKWVADGLHMVTLLCGCVSTYLIYQVVRDINENESGQPVTVLFACAIVIIPYCMAGAVQRWSAHSDPSPFDRNRKK